MSSENEYDDLEFSEDGEYQQAANAHAIKAYKHPVETLEPMTPKDMAYKEAARNFLRAMNVALSMIIEAENPLHQAWAIAFAIQSGICNGKSMETVGDQLGTTRAAISKGAVAYCKAAKLPASTYMRETAARISYRDARIESINKANSATKELQCRNYKKD